MQSYLEKHAPAKNQARFYNLVLLPNLFGEWTLFREWGRIGLGGKVRMEWFRDQDQAIGDYPKVWGNCVLLLMLAGIADVLLHPESSS
jgi:predicted DNA-binding WGR domain protein